MTPTIQELEHGWTVTKLQRAAVRVSLAQARFEIAVEGAYANGMSLGEIAAVTHVSPETLTRVIAEQTHHA